MQLAEKDSFSAHWEGSSSFGRLFVIRENGQKIHGGCFFYIRWKWKKLTGEILAN